CRFLPCASPAEGLARIKGPRHAADTANEAPPRSPMDSRLLIRMAAPLVLTLLTPIAVGFDWPAPMRWAILTTLTLSWFGFAAWLLLRGPTSPSRSPEQLRVVREQEHLLGELRTFVSREIEGSRNEVERARDL